MDIRKKINDLPIRRKFTLLLLIQVTLIGILALVSWAGIGKSAEAQDGFMRRIPKLEAIADTRFSLAYFRGETLGILGIAGTDPTLRVERLKKLTSVEEGLDKAISKLMALEWREEDKALLTKFQADMKDYRQAFAAAILKAATDSQGAHTRDWYSAGRSELEEARQILAKVENMLTTRSGVENTAIRVMFTRERWILGCCLLLAVAIGVALTQVLGRQVAAAVDEIESSMSALNHGDLTRSPRIESADELGHIGRSLKAVID